MALGVIQHTLAHSDDVELVEIDRNVVSRLPTSRSTADLDPFHSARQLEEGQVSTSEVGEGGGEGKDKGSSTGREGKRQASSPDDDQSFPSLEHALFEEDSDFDENTAVADDTRLLFNPSTRHEHREYLKKKLQRLQEAARTHQICKTIILKRCRVHGKLFGDLEAFLKLRAGHDFSSGSFYRPVEGMFHRPGDGLCGTLHGEDDIAGEERQAIKEERERDQATVYCLECCGAAFLLIFLAAALALYS